MGQIVDLARQYWPVLSGLGGVLTFVLAASAAKRAWQKRRFLHRVNFSLNYLDGNVLKIRTLREASIDEVLLNNPHGKAKVLRLAKRTRLEQPFLRLPDNDHWLVMNSILNEISEQFAVGLLAKSMGLPTRAATYLFGVTCERDEDVRINKIRVMIIEQSLLERIGELAGLEFEHAWHYVRVKTLNKMRELHEADQRARRQEPEAKRQAGHAGSVAPGAPGHLMQVELALPVPVSSIS